MSFYTFLMKYRAYQVGDDLTKLANLVYEETTFPKQSSDFDDISTYLETHANFAFNLSIFDEIWEQYLAER
ncbi:YozE family protein [Pseudolactococcus reticulitermitis]|uniref:UPF0346 protein RsY01_1490 n=1 Tax=Pseudolactococcus reticulitermitis TaxID=2025039 RepID=A0A224X5I8_9LACT|nr:YozE family protein [Lactococcus reticulitermitis]GAX47886.1 hypothetical protein RsY01_1490 [Lactococcus reticulitermitis]GHU39066.1 UPF0346 protein YuiB [Bacilli bacterium]GHU42908.1 UPF0346 protein YuiB [Bacilli bacterium]